MQRIKPRLTLMLGVAYLGASATAYAASQSFDITATTVPDVSLSEVTPLNYGTTMFVTAGGTCLMQATSPGSDLADMQWPNNTGVAAANYGDLSGSGCVNGLGTGTPGIYKVTGVAGAAVKITITGFTGTDFNFSPNSGCIVTYNGDNTDDADTCESFIPGVQETVNLAAAAETDTSGSTNSAVAAELVFTVGGTVTVGAVDLSPNTAYAEAFSVNVVY